MGRGFCAHTEGILKHTEKFEREFVVQGSPQHNRQSPPDHGWIHRLPPPGRPPLRPGEVIVVPTSKTIQNNLKDYSASQG
jgi:hypothetical protein